MNALAPVSTPPFPTNPRVGQTFGNWAWNGVRWVCSPASGISVKVTVFTASGVYMPSPGLVSVQVECIGGGGTGGDAGGGATAQAGGGGAGSGGYSRSTLPASLVLGGVNVTINGPVAAAPPNTFDREFSGGSVTFGGLVVANGGEGGGGNASAGALWGFPGAGAPPGIGDIALAGSPGDTGTTQSPGGSLNVIGGMGGSMWGGGGMPTLTGNPGVQPGHAATSPGGGGSGAGVNMQAGEANGGAGALGICVVTEYCFVDQGQCQDPCPPSSGCAPVPITDGSCLGPWGGGGPWR